MPQSDFGTPEYCPNCHKASAYIPRFQAIVLPEYANFAEAYYDAVNGLYFFDEINRIGLRIVSCLSCSQSVVLLDLFKDGKPVGFNQVIPREEAKKLDTVAPDLVADFFNEAEKSRRAGALRAAAVMYRGCIEAIINDLLKSVGNFNANIKKFEEAEDILTDELRKRIVDYANDIRLTGNRSVHQGTVFTEAELSDISSIIEEVVLHAYVQPAQRKAMRDSRAAKHSSGS